MALGDDLKDLAKSNVGIGALGGAGLGLLVQALRPKDKDQSAWKEYLMSALLGAGMGGLSGYAYDKTLYTPPTEDHSNLPSAASVGFKLNADTYPFDADDESLAHAAWLASRHPDDPYGVDMSEVMIGVPHDENGVPTPGRPFFVPPDMATRALNTLYPKALQRDIAPAWYAMRDGAAFTIMPDGALYPLVLDRVTDKNAPKLIRAMKPVYSPNR